MADILKFTEDHLWLRVEGNRAQLGISEYGQVELGEVIAVELPDVGDEVEKGEPFGEIESVIGFALPPEARSIPAAQLLRDQSLAAFQAWLNNPARVPY